jgi:4,5-DOPA dioxygenase extradiol
MPAVFVGHGSPMNAIEDTPYRREWERLGRELPRPEAILCVSAHWETEGLAVTASRAPETIHDFGGFPKALQEFEYPAPGDPELARTVVAQLRLEHVALDERRGLDHGAWSVLCGMYPKADVPVVQLSLDRARDGRGHLALARKLSALREEGVLIVGSGNIVHNLGFWDPRRREPYDWAARFDALIKKLIADGDYEAIADYENLGPDAEPSIHGPEHFVPLLYALGVRHPGERVSFFNERVENSMSMTGVHIGV